MRYRNCGSILVFTIILCSCELSPFDGGPDAVMPEETTIVEGTDLFLDDEAQGQYVFKTNDTKYLSPNGYTIWAVSGENDGEEFSPLSVTVNKESGRSEAGFGIVFCIQEIEGKPFMLSVLINTNGLYTVGKVVDGVFSHITGWESSGYINKGYGIKNDISVSYSPGSKDFGLDINGYAVATFAVSEDIVFEGSRDGFVAVIANNEGFPKNSVKVTFEK